MVILNQTTERYMRDIKNEIQMYGMTKAQLDLMVKQQAFPGQEMMFAAGMLSDAQEVIGADLNGANEGWISPQQANEARQFINCAKAIMFDVMDPSRRKAMKEAA
jgi:hypothetical protein